MPRVTWWTVATQIALALNSAHGDVLTPVLYDDAGVMSRQPHFGEAGTWTFAPADVDAPIEARSVAHAAARLVARYEGLDPSAGYAVRLTYATERWQGRTQRLLAGGVVVHDALELPRGTAETLEFALPPEAVVEGGLELVFERVDGPNAVVSEVWLLSDRPFPTLYVRSHSDMQGTLEVEALDGLLEPRSGAEVTVVAEGLREVASAGPDGLARLALVDGLATTPPSALVTVIASADGMTATEELTAASILLREPRLTPLPLSVSGVRRPVLRLDGEWLFLAEPEAGWHHAGAGGRAWDTIAVPGSWAMQGFAVPSGAAAAYQIEFWVPADWAGHCVRARFDAVYSVAEAYVNGAHVGSHEGGFTPFEVDATAHIRPGRANTLSLAVTSESLADRLASASTYARHPLGGITRSVRLVCVPQTHIAKLHVEADLDAQYTNATLRVFGRVDGPPEGARIGIVLRQAGGRRVPLRLPRTSVREDGSFELVREVASPAKWDSEHPSLYTLEADLLLDGRVTERVEKRIGFREVEVRGAELLVNGVPVKLRGVCRHEQGRDRGRSTTSDSRRRDVDLLKAANVNYVRTAHYPPDEEFLSLCDEAGIFVQDEAPWCWVSAADASDPALLPLMMRSNAEMIERDRDHPCVIIWDLANESSWGRNYERIHEYTRRVDPTRPTLFSYQPDPSPTDVITWHYPGPTGPERTVQSDKPVTFDEYMHLNCYAPDEVSLDPGLRDYWGSALESMWTAMQHAPNCLGGAIWCWADDVFDVPGLGSVGYGEWGPIDGWQRPKPEWWHVRKVYSPVHTRVPFVEPGELLAVPIENRHNFANLSEVRCEWRIGGRKGTVWADIPPRATGFLQVPAAGAAGDTLELRFTSAAGRLIDEYAIPVGDTSAGEGGTDAMDHPTPELTEEPDAYHIVGDGFRLRVSRDTGALEAWVADDPVVTGGPCLAATLQGTAMDAFADSSDAAAAWVAAEVEGNTVRVHVRKGLAFGEVAYDYRVHGNGSIGVETALAYTSEECLVREVGLLWRAAPGLTTLEWERDGLWTVYPDWHIGRPAGRAEAFEHRSHAAPRPDHWALDPDPRGSNDFRGTKYHIRRAALVGRRAALEVLSDGTQHVRATVVEDSVLLRVNDFANGGGEPFLAGHYGPQMRTIKPGETVTAHANVRLTRPTTPSGSRSAPGPR